MHGLRKPSTVLDLISIPLPSYSDSAAFLRACSKTLFCAALPCDAGPWPLVRERLRQSWLSLPDSVAIAAAVQISSAARAQEVLTMGVMATAANPGRLTLWQSKVQRMRVVEVPSVLLSALEKVQLNGSRLFFPHISYAVYKNYLSRAGLLCLTFDDRHDKTHLLRYLPILARSNALERDEEIQNYLGHARLASTHRYMTALPAVLSQLERR